MAKAESLARSNQIPQNSLFKGLFINFRGDLTGGLTTAVVTIPLALAFAVASGMEPKAGIYTAIVAGVVATVFGGSPVQITGPTGAMAVILVGVVAKYGVEKVWIASVMAGIIQIALGVAKLGRLVKFIPYPVIVGFTNGIAVIIFCSQLNDFLGLHLPNQERFLQALWQTITNLESYNWFAIALAILTIGTKLLWEGINQAIPGSLISLVVATLAAIVAKSQWNLEVPTIGLIPQSLPMPQSILYWNDFQVIRELITPAIALAALGSIESLLAAVVADGMIVGDRHNSDKQLIGQGLANMIVPFLGGFPATGTISRTAVNVRAGGKTRLSGVIHSVALALIVLAFAPLASQVPMAALAGILILTSISMMEWKAIGWLLSTAYADFGVMMLTWLVTVCFDLVLAVEVGLIAAGVFFVKRMSELSFVKTSEDCFLNDGVPLELGKQIAIYRIDGPIFFGAADRFVSFLRDAPEVKFLILRMRYVLTMDTTGLMALEEIYRYLQRHNCQLILTGLCPEVEQLLDRSGLLKEIGKENCFDNTEEALSQIMPPQQLVEV